MRLNIPCVPVLIPWWFPLSGAAILQHYQLSYQRLASCFPEVLWPFAEFSERLKIEGESTFSTVFPVIFKLLELSPPPFTAVYKPYCDLQKKEIENIQKEENMSLPQDIDYFSLPVSLSQEVREILDRVRPSSVSS